MTKKQLLCALCLTTLISPVTAQELNIPNSFQNGQVADALDLNDNFTAVETIFNAYIFFDTDKGNYAAGDGLRVSEFEFEQDPDGFGTYVGRFNTAVGDGALESNTLGWSNTAVGYNAMQASADERSGEGASTPSPRAAEGNTALGAYALSQAIRPYRIVAIGENAAASALLPGDSVVIGGGAMAAATSISRNVAVGSGALSEAVGAGDSVAIGQFAMGASNCAPENVAIGSGALSSTGDTNDAFEGCFSEGVWTYELGAYNTGVGGSALSTNVRGAKNTALGYQAGHQGFEDIRGEVIDNGMALGYQAKVRNSNEVQIGDKNITAVYLGKRVGDPAGGNDANLFLRGFVQASNVQVASDERLKEDIEPLDTGLSFVNDLSPMSYRYTEGADKRSVFGLVAQDVEGVLKAHGLNNNRLVSSGGAADFLSVSYLDLIAPMIKAIQELDEAAAEKDERIATLEAQIIEQQENMLALIKSQQQRLAELEARLAVDAFASR